MRRYNMRKLFTNYKVNKADYKTCIILRKVYVKVT